MVEIITAKCSGCGHVVKVPAALGGKRAKCPQCAQVITIPTRPDPGGGEFVSDDMLPEVARDEDVVEGLPVEEDEVLEGEPVDETPSGIRRRSMTPRRGTQTATRGGVRGRTSGAHQRATARGAASPPAKSSSAVPVVVGAVIVAAALGAVLVVALSGRSGGKSPKTEEKTAQRPEVPALTEADFALQRRCIEYIQVFNSGNVIETLRFYSYAPADEQKLRRAIGSMMEQVGRYENVAFKSFQAASGVVTFQHAKGERTINWKDVNGTWLIVDQP